MKDIYFVSSNKGKIKEAQEILAFPIKIKKLNLTEIQSLDVEEIVRHKTESAFAILQKPLIVDDVGIYVEAWNGFPGPFVKYIDVAGGCELLLKMMKGEKNRNAFTRVAIGYHDGKEVHVFIGEVLLTVSTEIRGTNGWGYDPIMIPRNDTRTFAEMTSEEKNAISHRRNALEKLKEYLSKHEM